MHEQQRRAPAHARYVHASRKHASHARFACASSALVMNAALATPMRRVCETSTGGWLAFDLQSSGGDDRCVAS